MVTKCQSAGQLACPDATVAGPTCRLTNRGHVPLHLLTERMWQVAESVQTGRSTLLSRPGTIGGDDALDVPDGASSDRRREARTGRAAGGSAVVPMLASCPGVFAAPCLLLGVCCTVDAAPAFAFTGWPQWETEAGGGPPVRQKYR